MKQQYKPQVAAGVLLSRHGEVHRDIGSRTACGRGFAPARVATVSNVQAIVFKLPLCVGCYPGHRDLGGRGTSS